ncbi:hypothetical protein [Polynucleobacter necessarius]|uniref:hypothetical protein n=1 Tax=Polynucleobacter necessarius TaxID=576610 RepID=UPI000E0961CE|nr:hypothetical protein [Polynucleobacter necessarius]
MPSRHISPQSFDKLLYELGDDPVIPDLHGIRKPASPKAPAKAPIQIQLPGLVDLKKIGVLAGLGIELACFGLYLFALFEQAPSDLSASNHHLQLEVSKLQKELVALREEILDVEDEIYESMDLLEVSIHSFNKNKSSKNSKPMDLAIPLESELRHWRYLGLSQIQDSQRAFFTMAKGW